MYNCPVTPLQATIVFVAASILATGLGVLTAFLLAR